MTKQEKINLIKTKVNEDQLCQWLLAQWGNSLAIYEDGQVVVGQDVGNEINPDERPFAGMVCPGIGNIDTTQYTEDFVTQDHETREYIVNETGERIDLEEVIRRCCDEGDVSNDLESLRDKLIEDIDT